jgi:hypothetical protein
MNEEAGYEATPFEMEYTPFLPSWDTRITYLLCGKDGQHYRIIIYMLNGEKVRFMMGHTESVVDVVQSHARQRWEELMQEGYFLKDVETAKNSPAMAKQMEDNMTEYLKDKSGYEYMSEYALDA